MFFSIKRGWGGCKIWMENSINFNVSFTETFPKLKLWIALNRLNWLGWIGPQEKKLSDPSKSKRVTAILNFSLVRFYNTVQSMRTLLRQRYLAQDTLQIIQPHERTVFVNFMPIHGREKITKIEVSFETLYWDGCFRKHVGNSVQSE